LALDLSFIHRVYRTGSILALLGAGLLWEAAGRGASLGWLVGALLSLMMLAGLEWSIKRFIQPDSRSARGLLGALLAKMAGAAVVLVLVFFAATTEGKMGWRVLLWVLAGFAMPHAVIVLKLVGQKVRQLMDAGAAPPSRPV
jgi:hypothetical protein